MKQENDVNNQVLEDLIQTISRSRVQSHSYFEQYGVTVPQSGVLKALQAKGSLSVGELASHLYLKTSTISGIVDRLERNNYIVRIRGNNGDRRVVHVSLTEDGNKLVVKLPQTSFDKVLKAISRFSGDETQTLMTLLKRLLNYMNE